MIGTNIGIDFGTSAIKIFMENKGVILTEPNAIVYDENNKIYAIGQKAYELDEKCPSNLHVVHPVCNGIISDYTATRQMLSYYLAKVCKNAIFKPNVIMSVPSSVTNLERRTLLDLITSAGAAKACLIETTLASALGTGIGTDRHNGVMVIDIGAGSADIAIITMGCVSVSQTVNAGGDDLNEAIIRHMKRERDIVIGHKTAESLKVKIGSAILRDVELGMTVKGKNYITEMPVSFEASSTEIYLAMRPVLEELINAIKKMLEDTTPDLAADIMESGIYVTGGGSKLRSIDKMLKQKLNINVKLPAEPTKCVAMGIGEAMSDIDILSTNGYVFKSRNEISGLDSDGE